MQLFDFPEICMTEASAGSGKTYALSRRYVQLLLKVSKEHPQAFKSILAITFTNKASIEMKTRVLYFLKKIALNQLSEKQAQDFLKPLNISQEQAALHAFELMDSLIRHYHFFSIKTIDSFINTLLAGCAFKINLSARFKISRNSDDYLQQSLDSWISQASTNAKIRGILEDFVHQYLFLENRSGWFPKQELFSALKMLFGEYNTYQKSFLIYPINSKDLYFSKKEFLSLVKDIRNSFDEGVNKRFYESLGRFLDENPVSFDLDDLSRYFAYPEFPANKNAKITAQLADKWLEAHRAASNLCLAESYGVFNPYIEIFNQVSLNLEKLCSQEDILFLSQLNRKASSLIDGGISVSELYYRLAVRFHHYLIDEFQDTSLSQWQNLSLMVQEALSSDGSLYLVGDRKQAIYSFRGGESRLFDQLPEQLANAPLRKEYLTKNWRSHQRIVEFNNLVFSQTNLNDFFSRRQEALGEKDKSNEEVYFNEGDIQEVQDIFAHAKQEARDDLPYGYVQVMRIDGKRKEERQALTKDRLLEILKSVQGRFLLKDIAILTRTNSQVEEVTSWLIAQGIHAQSERSCDIKNHHLIIEVFDLLKFLHNPQDDVSLARVLLGDAFAQASAISHEDLREFLFQCRLNRDKILTTSIYQEFKDKYPQVALELIEDLFKLVGVYPVYELVVSIYARLKLERFEDSSGFLMHFLELIKRQEEYSCDLEAFIEYFQELSSEERFVTVQAQDAVSVMTIHKAKGLQFQAVILPYFEMSIGALKSTDKALSYVLDIQQQGLHMLRLKKTYGRFNPQLKEYYEDEYKKSLMGELNNAYVALTRAVCEMYVLIPSKSSNSMNQANFLIPEGFDQFGQHIGFNKLQSQDKLDPLLSCQLNPRWIDQLKEELSVDERAQERLQGIILHYCLAQITQIKGDLKILVVQIVQKAQAQFGQIEQGFYIKALEALLRREDVQPFFDMEDDVQVLCEQEIVNQYGDAKRIDRMLIFKDKVWIVDFKTGSRQEDSHKQQIQEYQQLVEKLYPSKKVEGFLVYIDHE